MPALVSIQGLSITLSVALVVITGLLVGSLAYSSGNRSTKDARDVGDEGVQLALQGGTNSTEVMAKNLMDVSMVAVVSEVNAYFASIDAALQFCQNMLTSVHPDNATNPEWISDTFRHALFSVFKTHHNTASQIGWFPVEFSPDSTPNWGGSLGYVVGDLSTVDEPYLNPNGPTYVVFETRDPAGTKLQANNDTFWLGIADDQGRFTDYQYDTPSYILENAAWNIVHDRAINNMVKPDDGTTDTILDPPDVIIRTPITTVYQSLVLYSYIGLTSPLQVNRYPRQDGRMGLLKAGSSTKDISRMMAAITPKGAVLYAVETSHWDGSTGNIIGCSEGEAWDWEEVQLYPPPVPKVPIAVPKNVLNHEVPAIQQHGNMTLSHGGYDAASKSTSMEVLNVVTENGTTTYWGVVQKYSLTGLTWYFSFLLERDLLMSRIDKSMEDIQKRTQQSRADSDAKQRKDFILAVCITVACATVLLVCSVMLVRLIVMPLLKLAEDMECVALMRLDEVNEEHTSQLAEVHKMQTSFREMMKNLREYRNYMPQSVLVTSELSSEESPTTLSDFPKNSKGSSTEQSRKAMAGFVGDTLKRKTVTVVMFNISNWMEIVNAASETDVMSVHADYLSMLISPVTANKGVPETFNGDRLLCSFNAVIHTASHRVLCAQACHAARASVSSYSATPLRLSFGAASCDARVGNMGCNGMKKFTIISPAVPYVHVLERLNNKMKGKGFIDHLIKTEVMIKYGVRCIDSVRYLKRSNEPLKFYELMDVMEVKDEEWMYQLETCRTTQYAHWNTAMDLMIESHAYDEAKAELKKYNAEPDPMLSRFYYLLDSRNHEPLTA